MVALQFLLISIYTAALGSLEIVACLLVPGGRALRPIARLWSRLVLATCRVRCLADYADALDPAVPSIYVANHQSQLDIPALARSMPTDYRVVTKRSLLHIPVLGWALWLAGFVFIDRSDRERSIRSLDKAVTRLRNGSSLVFFAEGTRSADGTLLPFKKGAFVLALQAGVPIVPVSIAGGHALLPKGSVRVRPGTIAVSFGEPVDTRRFTMATKKALIDTVRERIAAGLRRTSAE